LRKGIEEGYEDRYGKVFIHRMDFEGMEHVGRRNCEREVLQNLKKKEGKVLVLNIVVCLLLI
jgi:hypothetical protein